MMIKDKLIALAIDEVGYTEGRPSRSDLPNYLGKGLAQFRSW